MKAQDLSANEIQNLILKAAYGGGLPLGLAEDFAALAPHLDLEDLGSCPCTGTPSEIATILIALDLLRAGEGAQTVKAQAGLIRACISRAQTALGQTLIWQETHGGAVFERFAETPPRPVESFGRRPVPAALLDHLQDLAARRLVPETEASRASGAGAGLLDND